MEVILEKLKLLKKPEVPTLKDLNEVIKTIQLPNASKFREELLPIVEKLKEAIEKSVRVIEIS